MVLLKFWESMRGWFVEQGYHLYKFVTVNAVEYTYAKSTIPYNPHPKLDLEEMIYNAGEDPFPYAYLGGDPNDWEMPMRPLYSMFDELSVSPLYILDDEDRLMGLCRDI